MTTKNNTPDSSATSGEVPHKVAASFLRKHDGLNVIKKNTVAYSIAVSALQSALYRSPAPQAATTEQVGEAVADETVRELAEFVVKHAVADHIDTNGPDCRSCACCDKEIPINTSLYGPLTLEHRNDCLFVKAQAILASPAATTASASGGNAPFGCQRSVLKIGMCRQWCGNSYKCAVGAFLIYVEGQPVDVRRHYAEKHKMALPANPTMSGAEIRRSTRVEMDCGYGVYLYQDGRLSIVGDSDAVVLQPGMRFCIIPPATF